MNPELRAADIRAQFRNLKEQSAIAAIGGVKFPLEWRY